MKYVHLEWLDYSEDEYQKEKDVRMSSESDLSEGTVRVYHARKNRCKGKVLSIHETAAACSIRANYVSKKNGYEKAYFFMTFPDSTRLNVGDVGYFIPNGIAISAAVPNFELIKD
jgi:hypothetical protein